MSTVTSIKQRQVEIEISDNQKIVVRRMKRKAACSFIKKLAEHLAALGAGGAALTDLNAMGAKLPELIMKADELSVELVTNSTDLNAEAVNDLDVAQFMGVLQAAVELNLGDELKNSFAGIATTLGALMPATKTSSGD